MENHHHHEHHAHLHAKHGKIRDELKAHIGIKASTVDRTAEFLSGQFGSIWFLAINIVIFFAWIMINLGFVSVIKPFDPYPFILLTMTVSLEAIVLSIIVLISQNRQGHVADVRERVDVEIDVRAEEEISKVLVMVEKIARKLEIPVHDPELHRMEQQTDLARIKRDIENNIES